ncbi:hypothetical protein CMQ_1137 [Grosmannia clavigera kw1407]|uniref:non-specific serine/threonine protein kinase n=1 Tax=Grosmannia clavigera (strain kw1407 / UAMH 11150) TaxID=655863 RepID=F0XC42_GROCL|nr:uncharacterized protein CMQ_1137 [Grosmannia clavigera kw1407]EFX04209.1 hypothetical protein CMQ_1137 [Grosmannia clavigera kw1407]
MLGTLTVRTYGKKTGSRTKQGLFYTKLPSSPTDRKKRHRQIESKAIDGLSEQLTLVSLDTTHEPTESGHTTPPVPAKQVEPQEHLVETDKEIESDKVAVEENDVDQTGHTAVEDQLSGTSEIFDSYLDDSIEQGLRVLTWTDMCPPGDRIEKIAEASYAEVYRVTNVRGTSIIKAIRLSSPIKPQTKAQMKSGLVDEEPHDEEDLRGELAISELLADIPGFVVYKERYIVRGRTTKDLLETHQTFHRRAKRQDPDRLQFYPSPSRYLEDTRFLVIELGDAGKALEDIVVQSVWQLWDVFLHVAIALARAEDQAGFEHRDLHEGNLCVRQITPPREKTEKDEESVMFGYSGLDITILDYGLSRADEPGSGTTGEPIAFDLEKDLSLFTSTHAAQCKVYRQMRSYLLKGDRVHLPPSCHQRPYDNGPDGRPISWKDFSPYTNVLWLAYLYGYLVRSFSGEKRDLASFRRLTRELWLHMDPNAPPAILSFASAADIVRFSVEAGWMTEEQLMGVGGNDTFNGGRAVEDGDGESQLLLETPDQSVCGSGSIVKAQTTDSGELEPSRPPRRRRPVVRYC